MTRYEAYIAKDWQQNGLAQVLVVRTRTEDSTDIGVFLVDVWCLGVKDVFCDFDLPIGSTAEAIEERLPEAMREPIHPACAKKLIDGAIAYAERLGFAPHRDFRKARKVLSGLDASLCPNEFTFGRDGKPCFVQGPDDSDERVDRILAMLTARCGEEGFEFVDEDEDDDLPDVEELRQDLMNWLHDEPAEVPRFYKFSGLVTALQICPQPLSPVKLLEKLWGPEGRTWGEEAELQEFITMVMFYWDYVADLVAAGVAPEATIADQIIDVWMDEFDEDIRPMGMMAGMIEWADGFMLATRYWPEAWGDALTRPELAEHWEIVRWWADFIGTDNKDRIADAADANPPRNISLAVQALARALRPVPPE